MASFILGFAVGAVLAVLLLRHRNSPANKLNDSRHLKKEERKNQILELLGTKDQITNDDAEELLGITHRTTTRYLSELVKEGKIKKRGRTRGVYYTK